MFSIRFFVHLIHDMFLSRHDNIRYSHEIHSHDEIYMQDRENKKKYTMWQLCMVFKLLLLPIDTEFQITKTKLLSDRNALKNAEKHNRVKKQYGRILKVKSNFHVIKFWFQIRQTTLLRCASQNIVLINLESKKVNLGEIFWIGETPIHRLNVHQQLVDNPENQKRNTGALTLIRLNNFEGHQIRPIEGIKWNDQREEKIARHIRYWRSYHLSTFIPKRLPSTETMGKHQQQQQH